MITGSQLRAARALLRWSAEDLAEKSKIGVATVRRAEASDESPSITEANLYALKCALEAAGVEFTNGGRPGVHLTYFMHTERGTKRLLFRRKNGVTPAGKWDDGRPAASLPKLARLNSDGFFVLEEPSEEDRERAKRLYGKAP